MPRMKKVYDILDTTDAVSDLQRIVQDFQEKDMTFEIVSFNVKFYPDGDATVTIEVETDDDLGIWPHSPDQAGVETIPWKNV